MRKFFGKATQTNIRSFGEFERLFGQIKTKKILFLKFFVFQIFGRLQNKKIVFFQKSLIFIAFFIKKDIFLEFLINFQAKI